jgi:hypothetical protein
MRASRFTAHAAPIPHDSRCQPDVEQFDQPLLSHTSLSTKQCLAARSSGDWNNCHCDHELSGLSAMRRPLSSTLKRNGGPPRELKYSSVALPDPPHHP